MDAVTQLPEPDVGDPLGLPLCLTLLVEGLLQPAHPVLEVEDTLLHGGTPLEEAADLVERAEGHRRAFGRCHSGDSTVT